jgi:hypothetical protein
MRVTPESPVEDRSSYLYQWDSAARKYFEHFEIHRQGAKEGVHKLFQNIFTRFRDPIQYRHRFQDIDVITYKQLLGDISKDEVAELNTVFGKRNYRFYLKSRKEPASITAWNILPLGALWGIGAGVAVYAKFVKGYNILWFAAPFIPVWTYLLYNWSRQPTQEIENCYRYLLAKRAATCELEKNRKRFSENEWTQSKEFHDVQGLLRSRHLTLYQLEADLVNRVNSGQFK